MGPLSADRLSNDTKLIDQLTSGSTPHNARYQQRATGPLNGKQASQKSVLPGQNGDLASPGYSPAGSFPFDFLTPDRDGSYQDLSLYKSSEESVVDSQKTEEKKKSQRKAFGQ